MTRRARGSASPPALRPLGSRRVLARAVGIRLAALLVAFGLAVLLAETALRVHHALGRPGSLDDLAPEARPVAAAANVTLGEILRISPFPRLVYQLEPGLRARFQGASLRVNRLGWREGEMDSAEPARRRLVGIGDSVMFGWGVEEEQRYLDVAEELLNELEPQPGWRTIALAAPGYNLAMEVEALKRYGLDPIPDLIVYGYAYNDRCLPNFVAERRSIWSPRSFLLDSLQGVRATLVERDHIVERPPAGELERQLGGQAFRSTFCRTAWVPRRYRHLVGDEAFDRALAELARIGQRLHRPVIFLNYGRSRVRLSGPLPPSIQMVDLYPAYREHLEAKGFATLETSDLVLRPSDPHPSVPAHRLIAEELVAALSGLDLLDPVRP